MTIRRVCLVLVACFLASACDDLVTDVNNTVVPAFARIKTVAVQPVCETIDFSGFQHGDIITSVASGFGFDIDLTLIPDGSSLGNIRIWDTDTPADGLQDPDLVWSGAGALCPDCEGQGNVIIIEDGAGFDLMGDSPDGGDIFLTGFAGHGTFIIRSYVAIDQDGTETAIRLLVDGTEDGASSGLGEGSVEIVAPNQQTFTEEAQFVIDGSGAVDDVELCQAPLGATGRMTGGGRQISFGGVSITRGFTIHCDIVLSNNLEINWSGGNRWHLDKPLTSAECFDDGELDPVPPAAPFDTFIGEGVGKLNGVDGSFVRFTFVDDGEPGRNDRAAIKVWAPGADPENDDPVLEIEDFLDRGNIQAHFDQPHGSNG